MLADIFLVTSASFSPSSSSTELRGLQQQQQTALADLFLGLASHLRASSLSSRTTWSTTTTTATVLADLFLGLASLLHFLQFAPLLQDLRGRGQVLLLPLRHVAVHTQCNRTVTYTIVSPAISYTVAVSLTLLLETVPSSSLSPASSSTPAFDG